MPFVEALRALGVRVHLECDGAAPGVDRDLERSLEHRAADPLVAPTVDDQELVEPVHTTTVLEGPS